MTEDEMKGETVPDSLPATPKSPPTRRVPPRSLQCFYLAAAAAAKLLQSCLTLCDPIDGSPPGSAVPGIFQARTLEWNPRPGKTPRAAV